MSYRVTMATAHRRRVEYSENTQQALIASAVDLFTRHGYSGTSLDEIAKQARVTKGALYHHFAGKQALFSAAFDVVEGDAVVRLTSVITSGDDPWTAAVAGLNAFLKVCLEPAYQRIVVREAPAVLGWDQWRNAEERSAYGVVRQALSGLIDAGAVEPMPLDVLAGLVFGALNAGAASIAHSSNPRQASTEVGECVERLLRGLRVSE